MAQEFETIVGKTIEAVELDDAKTQLTIRFADGSDAMWTAYGDCCSRSWVEHLTVPSDIRGAVVTASALPNEPYTTSDVGVEATSEQRAESDAWQEWPTDFLLVYQTSVATNRGEVILEYRNDSNGYYGGWMERAR